MTLCYEPACQEDLEPLFQLNKQLIEQYEDLSSIDYPKVLAWVRRNLQRNPSGVTRVLRDGILVGTSACAVRTANWNWTVCLSCPPSGGRASARRSCENVCGKPMFRFFFSCSARIHGQPHCTGEWGSGS